MKEDEDLSEDEQQFANRGGWRFDNLIKSMVSRLENFNNLAPIHEYGRHKAALKKKPLPAKKPSVNSNPSTAATEEEQD